MDRLEVVVMTSNKTLFKGPAMVVSSVNSVGPFDILPQHENFITLLKDKVIVKGLAAKVVEIPCQNGLLEVSENRVRVFLGV